jgi:DNA-binding response OmpR family regulator
MDTRPQLKITQLHTKARILAIDDSADALTILRLFLAAEGFDVLTAASASQALAQIEARLPDLIITDHMMPGLTGLELCQQLRSQEATRHIPIIVHTALDLPPEATQLYDALFVKPADLTALVRRIRALLAGSRLRAIRHTRFEAASA